MPAPGSILIVNDDLGLLEALRTALSPPHNVFTVQTGVEAFGILQQQPFDIVLLDCLLPDISGLMLHRALKQAYPSLLVVLMTGFGSEDVAIEALRGGAYDYVKKPISLTDLQARVENLLKCRQESRGLKPRLPWPLDPAPPHCERDPHGASIRRALAFIDRQLHAAIRLDQVAQEAGMSKFHFCRRFKGMTGLTFREFLAQRRIARAMELLRDQTRSVSQVLVDVGFKKLSHFSRAFHKLTGQPPSRYRRIVAKPGCEGSSTTFPRVSRANPGSKKQNQSSKSNSARRPIEMRHILRLWDSFALPPYSKIVGGPRIWVGPAVVNRLSSVTLLDLW